MAKIDSQILFLTTSPRTPEKMIPEINLLIENFKGELWNNETQCLFMKALSEEQYFNGKGENDPAFSARDRINRAPKSLGFVTLSPKISVTPAGERLICSKRKDEVFLRQMLKFQIPSPYHKPSDKAAIFWVKPYLEMLRLVRVMGTLKFDELQMFGMQLTDWRNFDLIVRKIETFREEKLKNEGNYKLFKARYLRWELERIYADRIARGETKTRESNDKSLDKFIKTQSGNMRDYADACFRYLRATGLVNVSHVGKSLSIVPERVEDVDFILKTVDPNPCYIDDERAYVSYLGDAAFPKLLTDDKVDLIKRIHKDFSYIDVKEDWTVELLKDILAEETERQKEKNLHNQIVEIKNYKLYDEIQNTFDQIERKELYDTPLILEWNTWRAMTMLDGGNIKANLNFDDFGNPLSTAQGNMADIVCDYGDFLLTVEVTLASGQRQYEMEGEPVSRHLGRLKKNSEKPCYSFFIAPTINEACVAHFYALHNVNISYYGGQSIIIPLPLNIFRKMLEDSYKVNYTPNPTHIHSFFECSKELVKQCRDEKHWFEEIQNKAMNWLNIK